MLTVTASEVLEPIGAEGEMVVPDCVYFAIGPHTPALRDHCILIFL